LSWPEEKVAVGLLQAAWVFSSLSELEQQAAQKEMSWGI
jgi:hypothetical protein